MTVWWMAVLFVIVVFYPCCLLAVLLLATPAPDDGELQYRDSRLYCYDLQAGRWRYVPPPEHPRPAAIMAERFDDSPRPMHSRDTLP